MDEATYVRQSYMREAESVYRYYWENEMTPVEQEWLHDCWQAQLAGDHPALRALQTNTPQRNNDTIRRRLAELGFVLNASGPIELPTGLELFLRHR